MSAPVTTRPLQWSPNTVAGTGVASGGTWTNGAWVQVQANTPSGYTIVSIMAKAILSGVAGKEGVVDVGWGQTSASVCVAGSWPFSIGQSLIGSTWDFMLPVPITLIPTGSNVFLRYRTSQNGIVTMDNLSIGYYASYDSTQRIDQTLYRDPSAANGTLITTPASAWTFTSWTTVSTLTVDAYLAGVSILPNDNAVTYPETEVELGIGAGPTSVGTMALVANGEGTFMSAWYPRVIPVSSGSAISARMRMNTSTATGVLVAPIYYADPALGCRNNAASTTYPVRRLRQTAHLSDEQLWLFFSKFQLDCEVGIGLNDGQGSDPQVMLSWSDDGGHTWSEEQWMSAGKNGEYKRRVIWRRLGRSRDRVWRIVVSDPVAWRLLTAYLDVTKGTS